MTSIEMAGLMLVCLVAGIVLSELCQAVARHTGNNTTGDTTEYGHKADTFTESTEL